MTKQNTDSSDFFLDLENMTFEKLDEAYQILEGLDLLTLKTLIAPMVNSKSGVLFLISSIFDKARLELIKKETDSNKEVEKEEREKREKKKEKEEKEEKEKAIEKENSNKVKTEQVKSKSESMIKDKYDEIDFSSIDSIIKFSKESSIEEFAQFLMDSAGTITDSMLMNSENLEKLVKSLCEEDKAVEDLDTRELENIRTSLLETVEKGIDITFSAMKNRVKEFSSFKEDQSLEENLQGLSILLAAMSESLDKIKKAKTTQELNEIFKTLENLVN